MLLSKYFLPLLKENPNNAYLMSHKLMIRSGMVKQETSGIYTWLPFGLRVLKNIEKIVRHNMDSFGGIEILMPCIQPGFLWEESNRLKDYGQEMLKFKDRNDNILLFGPTNEDMVTEIFRKNIHSYKALPKTLYHIQWKFRDEIRPRFGLMRSREFLMKDAYTFDIDKESGIKTYNDFYLAYIKIFHEIGVNVIPVFADNGPIGGKLSHEFHIPVKTGESKIFYHKRMQDLLREKCHDVEVLQSLYSVSEERNFLDSTFSKESEILNTQSIEVGHIFYLGDKYSKKMGALVHDINGNLVPVEMSSYGIGISRLVAAIIEANHDEKGIIWNKKIAPFKFAIINLHITDLDCNKLSEYIYSFLKEKEIDVLYDDTEANPGIKLATNDLIGIPYQIIISRKKSSLAIIEFKDRKTGVIKEFSIEEFKNSIIDFLF